MPSFLAATAHAIALAGGRWRVLGFLNLPSGSQTTAAIQEKREAQPFITTTCANTNIRRVMKEPN